MNLKKFLLIGLLSLLVNTLIFSQSTNVTNVISIATPNPAALVKDYKIPINYYLGLPDINIPLHVLSHNGLEIPIGLSYDASGIRIDQTPTWTGLGWALQCGGVIVREIQGINDERYPSGYLYAQRLPVGLLPDWKINENAFDDLTNSLNYDTDAGNTCYRIINGLDTSPDRFVFNFNGIRGEFYLDRNGNVVTNSKHKIQYVIEDKYPGEDQRIDYFKEFTITTVEGIKYTFGPREHQNTSTYFYGVSSPPSSASYDATWYLKSVESLDALSKVNFDYGFDEASYTTSSSVNVKSNEKISITRGASSGVRQYNDSKISIIEQGNLFLKRIYSDVEEIIFETQPYNSGYIKQQLNFIKIRNKLTGKEWHYKFEFENYGPANTATSRFQLSSIKRIGGETEETLYSFLYNSTTTGFITGNLNQESFTGIDHWGYNNGPKVYKTRLPYGSSFFRYDGTQVTPIDRTAVPTYIKAGSLEKIVIPTKGSIEFEFEINDYSHVSQTMLSSRKIASGLRLKKMTYTDARDNANNIVKLFEYRLSSNPNLSSGVILFEPVYFGVYNGPNFTSDFWMSEPILPINIGYSEVTEINGDGSKTIHTFNSARDYPPVIDNGEFSVVVHAEDVNFKMKLENPNLIPFLISDKVNTHLRGTLKSRSMFDKDGFKIRETNYTYKTWTAGRLFNIDYIGFDLDLNGGNGLGSPGGIPNGVGFLSKNFINVFRYELESETEINYFQTTPPTSLMSSGQYKYNDYQLPVEILKTDSKGRTIKQMFTYPTDYNPNAMGGNMGNLLTKSAIGKIIESRTIIDNNIVNGTVYEYDSYARILKTLQLETSVLIPSSSATINPNNHISLPAYYKSSNEYKYDQGRLVEISKNGYSKSFLWGYINARVVAQIENATFGNSFYSSFEDNGVNDALAKTGDKIHVGGFTFNQPSWLTVLPDSKLSYWYYENNTWKYNEQLYSGGNFTINHQKIDELRIYPRNALMTTYTHDILGGVSSAIDLNAEATKFEFDSFNRLKLIRDDDRNILKVLTYHLPR